MQRRMLSKEDEAASGGEEVEVRREDQDKINRFSRLHQREINLVTELRAKEVLHNPLLRILPFVLPIQQKQKEDLEEVSTEIELADEDTKIPYKIGDSFIALPPSEIQDLLESSTEKIDGTVSELEDKLSILRDEMEELKVGLYARFGKSINLET
ncbi:MAG: hypothetical protein M1820_005104 [Bogoriella megaspora]|nr:MAG: hypothetical protein M1820_005104 [Bogoriella megaspora]